MRDSLIVIEGKMDNKIVPGNSTKEYCPEIKN
jgi:hypothetical protein